MLHADVAVLDELLAPDLIFTHHLGQVLTKHQDIAAHQSGPLRFHTLLPTEQSIQIYQGFAVVSVVIHLIGSVAGTALDAHIRSTRVWSISASGMLHIRASRATVLHGPSCKDGVGRAEPSSSQGQLGTLPRRARLWVIACQDGTRPTVVAGRRPCTSGHRRSR
ncbi:MAG: nuclear transport factor 2 family protein [Ktedonobacterales bacterium]|nr:nuclear transport factor 2 family protein [Ktedonobacterales bacterium]